MKKRTGQSSLRRTKFNSEILEKVHFDEDKRTAFEGKTAVQKCKLRLLDFTIFPCVRSLCYGKVFLF